MARFDARPEVSYVAWLKHDFKVGSIRALLVCFFRVVLCAHNLFVEAFFLLSELTNSECRNQDSHPKKNR